ncbi:Sphingomyelin phosphodiesterase 2 [Pseudocercospora fuligena]|uniref:Sphingomyelin phosphodiesterase 2 n=1 Tax=Pseudocercospora fuligena TaxID=685502 RepID=A0A8H6REX7_9PEZI|nr:Sphingomyelin phosphodiesterase 2 [Pseudocercospora fuligena]
MASIRSVLAAAPLLLQLGDAQSWYGSSSNTNTPGSKSFVAPAGYPTKVFSSYYPAPSGQEPQPAIYDPILNITYPANLTNPDTIPDEDLDPVYYPKPIANLSKADQEKAISTAIAQVKLIITNSSISSNCTKCIRALEIGKRAVQLAPSLVPPAMVSLCNETKFHSSSTCKEDFEATTFGAIWTQILAFANVSVGSEGNCTSNLCCRSNAKNSNEPAGQLSFPAPLYGYFECDTPYDLGLAALQAVGPLTGTSKQNPLAWTIYTGDLVSHDPQTELSRAYTEYAEISIYDYMFGHYLTGPVFPVLGNHDTNPEAIDAPHSLPGPLGQQMSWNFDHVSALWQHEGWLSKEAANQARLHYGAYSIKNHYGLRMITFNSDFWYKSNYLNFINTSNPDVSGMFKWVIQELQAAEDAGERVWLFAHVLSGWDGTNPVPNPTNLFYEIVERYSPHVIANIFFGHTHEDQFMIYYANNATNQSRDTALNVGWIGPSVTPLTNLNSGFRMYEVDTGSFDIYEAYTWYADVSSFSNLTTHGPTFQLEYSTRETYGPAAKWPADAPLNATFWHAVTEAMETDHSLVSRFNTLQGKSSVKSPNCTNSACAEAKICYMRSGSVPLGRQCPQGYGSVQSAFKPTS